MRLLHCSDFHFRRPWYDWLVAQAGSYDLVCLSGDLLDMWPSAKVSLHRQARWVQSWLAAWPDRTPIYVCTGNHDYWPEPEITTDVFAGGGWLRMARRLGVVFVDGDHDVRQGYHMECTEWAEKPVVRVPEPSIVICHAPPSGSDVGSDLGSDIGDDEVTQAAWELPKGSLILSGHIHTPKRWLCRLHRTWCFNPGVGRDDVIPNHVIIDTDLRKAWGCQWSAAGGGGGGGRVGPISIE